MNKNEYIELDRTFRPLRNGSTNTDVDDDVALEAFDFITEKSITWDKLAEKYRVILLAEAGAGKTSEIRQIAIKLRSENKAAFFIRLENIVDHFEFSFERGVPFQEFENWLQSDEEGWILLDSVDEARLKNSGDFETAVRKISCRLLEAKAVERTHIIITSRTNAWRPKTDLDLCNSWLSFETPVTEKNEIGVEGDNGDDKAGLKNKKNEKVEFTVFSLGDLSQEQIKTFIQHKGIEDTARFMDDIERHDARKYTTRPQDLDYLVPYWNNNQKIGTQLELMKDYVKRWLTERKQNYAALEDISNDDLGDGVRRVAAALTFTRESAIGVLDGSHQQGINIKEILPQWTDTQCQVLLTRPIFDEELYGAVRFHHRSVREFLTAQWLQKLLQEGGHRREIEGLLFREIYGVTVAVPAMRGVLFWLILFDEKIRERAFKIDVEIIFECGDPGKLPLTLRRNVLREICEKMSVFRYLATNYKSVQRFSNNDMADEINSLLIKYKDDNEIIFFLLRMIWLGRISDLLKEAKNYALNNAAEHYTRIAAIKAVRDLGSSDDNIDILESVLENKSVDRNILSEIVEGLESSERTLEMLFSALEKINDKEKYKSDGLNLSLPKFIDKLLPYLRIGYLKKSDSLLKTEPFVEHWWPCGVSIRYYWLMPSCLAVIKKLVSAKDANALSDESLTILSSAHVLKRYYDCDFDTISKEFSKRVVAWKALNYALFWKSVEMSRRSMSGKNGTRLSSFFQVSIWDKLWKFDGSDFDLIKNDIIKQDVDDNKLVALSLAFQLYKDNARPGKWKDDLKRIVSDQNSHELQKRLDNLLKPPAASDQEKQWRKEERDLERCDAARKTQEKKELEESINWLSENSDKLFDKDKLKKGETIEQHYYLLDKMRENNHSGFWGNADWENLKPVFGVDVAKSFRDGLVYFWRYHKPTLKSEKSLDDSTSYETILGLVGLAIESKEEEGWLDKLTEAEAGIACSYAFREPNGFPNWFSQLYAKFPRLVKDYILKEIEWELKKWPNEKELHYVISDISAYGEWIWDDIAPAFIKPLNQGIQNDRLLEYLLKIVQGSSICDHAIADIARENIENVKDQNKLAIWYAVWVGVQPRCAISKLSEKLASITDDKDALEFSMRFVTGLVGEHYQQLALRNAFKSPEYLKEIHLLMHQYIRENDDLNRTNKGVYRPDLRDDAQEARNRLISILEGIPGKKSYKALKYLAENHPVEHYKKWINNLARKKAEEDSDLERRSLEQFHDFSTTQENTPSTYRQLYDLAVLRLLDLKHDLEGGDNSLAPILINQDERKIRNYIGGWCRRESKKRYSIAQEEELSDRKRTDIRFVGSGFDAPVPVELKLADNWSGPELFERLENQLCGDYLRDERSKCGVFLLLHLGKKISWEIPNGNKKANFSDLIEALESRCVEISREHKNVEDVKTIAIDLSKRMKSSTKRNF